MLKRKTMKTSQRPASTFRREGAAVKGGGVQRILFDTPNPANTFETPDQEIRSLANRWLALYDPNVGLLGNLDAKIHDDPEYTRQYFRPFGPHALHPYRESAAAVFCLLELGQHVEIANRMLDTILRRGQIIRPRSPDHGKFFWYWEEKELRDPNANFFIGIALFLIHRLEQARLTPSNRTTLRRALNRLHAVFRDEVEAGGSLVYVNPRLAAHAMRLLLSEEFAKSDTPAAAKMFAEYLHFLLTRGVNESYTPSYYGVNLITLYTTILLSRSQRIKKVASKLLDEVFYKEMSFFGELFPAPFRRGYNHEFRAFNRSWINFCLGLSSTYHTHTIQPDCYLPALIYPLINRMQEQFGNPVDSPKHLPQTMRGIVFDTCVATSHRSRHFLLGSFNDYPPITTLWQTAAAGGQGWQDCSLFLSTPTPMETTGALRLEAVDASGRLMTHPISRPFSRSTYGPLYPRLSFPPVPKVWILQKGGHALCLCKIDRVDAELRRLGWSFHISRFQGRLMTLNGRPLDPAGGRIAVPRGVILDLDGIWIVLLPLERVDMARSDLLMGGFIPPMVEIVGDDSGLGVTMDHYRGAARRLTQNHVDGGFLLLVKEKAALPDLRRLLAYVRRIKLTDVWDCDHIHASNDRRDGRRRVEAITPDSRLVLEIDYYENKELARHIDGRLERVPRQLRMIVPAQ